MIVGRPFSLFLFVLFTSGLVAFGRRMHYVLFFVNRNSVVWLIYLLAVLRHIYFAIFIEYLMETSNV
jgi:hypothetical protein